MTTPASGETVANDRELMKPADGWWNQARTISFLNASFVTIQEVHFKNNADYAKVFVHLHNGTDQLRGNTLLDIDALIFQNVSDGLVLRMDLSSKVGADHIVILNSSIDLCNSNESQSFDQLTYLIAQEIEKYGNLSFSCPFHSGNYMVRNFHIDTENVLIKFAPPGEYRIVIDIKYKAETSTMAIPIFDIELYATIVQDG
ncbi:uncharacterized protein LOC134204395 [Armigeres subalbatus]|uniref:uncharacterized protein LOC134204395 n=1 Tax=Armigeres subalbatus TaxID=124917 RepID=UPI002ED1A9F6